MRIEGRWCYLYRAIDKEGNLVDVYLSDVRDQAAAEAFFVQAAKTTGIYPEQITTDKEAALYPAIDNTFGDYTTHRDNKHMNNRLEQDHREVKSRTGPMKGFKDIICALIFCTAFPVDDLISTSPSVSGCRVTDLTHGKTSLGLDRTMLSSQKLPTSLEDRLVYPRVKRYSVENILRTL